MQMRSEGLHARWLPSLLKLGLRPMPNVYSTLYGTKASNVEHFLRHYSRNRVETQHKSTHNRFSTAYASTYLARPMLTKATEATTKL